MKVFTMLFAALMLLAGCSQTPEEKAQELITEELKMRLDDPSSYESVKFGTLDSVMTNIYNDPEIMAVEDKRTSFTRRTIAYLDKATYYQNEGLLSIYQFYLDSIKLMKDSSELVSFELQTMRENFKPKFVGWKMTHTFRAKQAGQDKKIEERIAYFDKEFTKLLDIRAIDGTNP